MRHPKVRRLRRSKHWVVMYVPSRDRPWMGPYDTKQEAEDDCDGVARFFEMNPELRDTTAAEALEKLVADMRAAMEHLSEEHIDWFQKRAAWLLTQAEQRNVYEE